MSKSRLSDQAVELARLTRDLSRCCQAKEEQLLAKFKLSCAEGRVLLCIADLNLQSASEIAYRLAISKGRLSSLIDNLVKKRFLTRTESPADRRSNTLQLTKPGKNVAREVAAMQTSFHESLLLRFRPEERSQVLVILDRLHLAIEDLRGQMTALV